MGSRRFIAGEALGHAGGAALEERPREESAGEQVVVAWGDRLAGSIALRERVRPEARGALAALARLGFRAEVLTGDLPERGAALEEALGVPVRAGLLPLEKVSRIEALGKGGAVVVMVGDGINDTPALAASTVGIAMGSGVDLARATADVILLGGPGGPSLEALPRLVDLSRRTVRRIRWNLFWAFAYNSVAMALAACGILGPASAAALMVISSLFVVGGSLAGREVTSDFRPPTSDFLKAP